MELLEAGFDVTVVDNLCNSSREALRRVESITKKSISFHEADIRDAAALAKIFEVEKPQAVIHFAGLKAVGESVEKPLEYYDNNVSGTLTLLLAMRTAGPAILPPAMPPRYWPNASLAGRRNSALKKCARMPGAGSSRTMMGYA